MVDPDFLACHLDLVLDDATIPELPNHYRGKVRDNYDLPDGRRLIIASDRLSAFDRNIVAIPFKGQVLTQIARFWFDRTADICPNHVIDYPDPNVLLCKRLDILPIEIVVRDYLAGTTATSVGSMYRTGRREIYGLRFPDGLRENEKLPQTVITPTTKARDGEHDEPVTPAEILDRGLLTAAQWQAVSEKALALFARGRDIDGQILLADEIHTPDSSRYWFAESYPGRFAAGEPPDSFDKDFVRRWVAARVDPYHDPIPPIPREIITEAARIYVSVFETITGERFAVARPETPVLERIRTNLRRFF